MHPDFISIGPFTIHTYGVMMALGFLAGLGNWILLGLRIGRNSQFCTDLMFWVMASGILGARIAYVFENWQDYAADPLTIVRIDQGGLIFYGGFVASGIAVFVFSRRHKISLPSLTDFVVTSVPIAHALGRIGCFLNGCCFGACTSSSWGVHFSKHSIPWYSQVRAGVINADVPSSLAVHPVQLYEAAFNVLVYGVLVWLFRRRLRQGVVTAAYLMLYAIGRFLLEFFRGDRGERLAVWQLSIGQFVSVFVFIAGLIVLLSLLKQPTKEDNHA